VRDILLAVNLLKSVGFTDITLCGRGLGAIPAVFASLISKDVKKTILRNALLAYHELALAPACKWPFSHIVPGVLKNFDLPDIYRVLKGKLSIIDPWNEKMELWEKKACARHVEKLGMDASLISFS